MLLEIDFAPEQRLALERLLASLPSKVFTADDSLGWVYQFWRTKKKEEVNKSGQKIDGRSLPAVTQLFTEHYMVEFLLHNTIGAWWVGSRLESRLQPVPAGVPASAGPRSLGSSDTGPAKAGTPTETGSESRSPGFSRLREEEPGKGPAKAGTPTLSYLRWKDNGTPAAGTFEGWPKTLAEFTMLDPCCGSGHFLVAAFRLLVPMRMHDEGISARAACDAVLRQNLFGLELDPRCTQIAAFALALAAWTYPGPDGQPLGYRPLPPLNIACSGQGVVGTKEEWARFANGGGDGRFREGMERLYDLFQKAPTLGSLINPRTVTEDLFALGFDALRGTLERALKKLGSQADPDRAAVGVAAQGIALAASLMAREFTLVATNVPYLARGKQCGELRDYIEDVHPAGKADLATVFVERCLEYCADAGSTALVTPQNWLFLGSYKALRERLLRQVTWDVVAKLGPGAFETISGEMVNVALLIHTLSLPGGRHEFAGLDVSCSREPAAKLKALRACEPGSVGQVVQTNNPDARIVFDANNSQRRLEEFALCRLGLGTGDVPHYLLQYWELDSIARYWRRFQTTTDAVCDVGGYDSVVAWDSERQRVLGMTDAERKQAHNQDYRGREVWGCRGVAVSIMSDLKTCLYSGELFDKLVAAIVPRVRDHLPAVFCFVHSSDFLAEVRKLDNKLMVTNATLLKVPFDLEYWKKVAAREYPNGLPEPHSNDPTQWLFKGRQNGSTDPLQVAVARLLGYRWPEQEADDLDKLADRDGIVPIPPVRGEPPAAERLLNVLHSAFALESRLQPVPAGVPASAGLRSDEIPIAGPAEAGTPTPALIAGPAETGTPTPTPGPAEAGTPTPTPGPAEAGTPTPIRTPGPAEAGTPTRIRTPGAAEAGTPTPIRTPGPAEAGTPTPIRTAGPAEAGTPTPIRTPGPAEAGTPTPAADVTYRLLTEAGCRPGTTLDDWLRNSFFEQHCKRFHNRPFIWHIWDGRKDGFSALVNYHKLDQKALESLTYSYLGDWITAQSRSDSVGADLRLAAAQALQAKLKLILAGEPPYDIFVRWKPIHEQAIGWHPDLNGGVRMNIRPFIEAGILRKTPNIKWTKDRGKEPERDKDEYPWFWSGGAFVGDRVNDVHLTDEKKQAARDPRLVKGAKP